MTKAKSKPVGRTMRAAHAMKAASEGEMAMAVELIDVLPPNNEELSLTARRILLLMLEAAAGGAWQDEPHRILKRDLRGTHKSMDRARSALRELQSTVFVHASMLGGKPSEKTFSMFDNIDWQLAEGPEAFFNFEFGKTARQLLQHSEVYARLSKQAIVKFQGRYSLRLYEIGALLYLKRDPSWTGTVEELRSLLHVSDKMYSNFADLRKRVLAPAQGEINQLAEFDFSWQEFTSGRQVMSVRMTFTAKPGRRALAAAEEADRHSAGRQARRDDTVEKIVDGAKVIGPKPVAAAISSIMHHVAPNALRWPDDDDVVDYDPDTAELYQIAVNDGNNHAVSRLAAAYVLHMGDKRFQLRGDRLRSSWAGFVKAMAESWQRVS